MLYAQDTTHKRKSVGLVLSGGGAKGLAHIGVLRALEQNNIPIDYIAGTSMGAIVGGLYASGYSVDSIEKIFFSNELNEWLSSKIEDKYRYYFNTPKEDASLIKINFDVDKKFKTDIPISLINPMQMDYSFMEFFTSANEICGGDYSKLMIPFFCITSNVSDKKQSIQTQGDLGKSIRASMTFPLFFSPITIDGTIMCDGGVYNNFPSFEMDSLYKPDIIIGVKVADNFDTPNEEDLVLYIENMISLVSKYEVPKDRGLLIEPDMKFNDIMDFSNKKPCIYQGYRTAMANMKQIKYLVGDTIKKEIRDSIRNQFNSMKKEPIIGDILVNGVNGATKANFKLLLTMGISEDSLSLGTLKSNYLSFCSMPNIKNVKPKLYYDNLTKKYVFSVDVKKKNILQSKLGGMLSTDPISNMYLGLKYNFIKHYNYTFNVNCYLGRYYRSFMADFRMDFPNRTLPYYLEAEMNLNRWNYFRNRNGLFEYSATNYLVQNEKNLQIRFGFPTSRRSRFVAKIGIGHTKDEYFNNDVILSSDTNDITNFNNLVISLLNEMNTLDNNDFPTIGTYAKFNVQFVYGKEEFEQGNTLWISIREKEKTHSWVQLEYDLKHFWKINNFYSFSLMTEVYYSFQDLFLTRRSCLLNAGIYSPTQETLTRFYTEYRANQFGGIGTEHSFRLGTSAIGNTYVRLGAYTFIPIKEILSNDNKEPYYGEFLQKVYCIGSAGLVFATKIGNLSLTASFTQRENKDNGSWNISFNFGKIIFNNRNIDR